MDVWGKGIFLKCCWNRLKGKLQVSPDRGPDSSWNKLRQEVGHASLSRVRSWGFCAGPFGPWPLRELADWLEKEETMTHSTPLSQHRNIRRTVPENRESRKSSTKAGGYHQKEQGVMQMEFYLPIVQKQNAERCFFLSKLLWSRAR